MIIDRSGSFEDFLRRHRPRVMATWFSITIFDALAFGVVIVLEPSDGSQ